MNKYDELYRELAGPLAQTAFKPFKDWQFVYFSNGHYMIRMPLECFDSEYEETERTRYERIKMALTNTQKLAQMYHPVHIPADELQNFINKLPREITYQKVKCPTCDGTAICPHCGGECPKCTDGLIDGEPIGNTVGRVYVQLAYANFEAQMIEKLLRIAGAIGENAIFYKYSCPNGLNLFEIGAALIVVYPHIMDTVKLDKLYKFERRLPGVDDATNGDGIDG